MMPASSSSLLMWCAFFPDRSVLSCSASALALELWHKTTPKPNARFVHRMRFFFSSGWHLRPHTTQTNNEKVSDFVERPSFFDDHSNWQAKNSRTSSSTATTTYCLFLEESIGAGKAAEQQSTINGGKFSGNGSVARKGLGVKYNRPFAAAVFSGALSFATFHCHLMLQWQIAKLATLCLVGRHRLVWPRLASMFSSSNLPIDREAKVSAMQIYYLPNGSCRRFPFGYLPKVTQIWAFLLKGKEEYLCIVKGGRQNITWANTVVSFSLRKCNTFRFSRDIAAATSLETDWWSAFVIISIEFE